MQALQQRSNRALPQPPPPGGRAWKCRPFEVLRQLGTPTLTAQPPCTAAAPTGLRLLINRASPLCKERACRSNFHHLQIALTQKGQQQGADISTIARVVSVGSSGKRDGRGGCMELQLHRTPDALLAAQRLAAAGTLQVGDRRVPVRWATAAQPADTVRLLFLHAPPACAVEGFTAAVLCCAGYDFVRVVHEQLGGSPDLGDAELLVPYADSVVAYVQAPDDDLVLRHMPDSFTVEGRSQTCRIFVQGRSVQQPWLWAKEQEMCLAERRAAQRVAAAQQQQQQRGGQHAGEQQQQQRQPPRPADTPEVEMEVDEGQQQQESEQQDEAAAAAAAALAAVFAGGAGVSQAPAQPPQPPQPDDEDMDDAAAEGLLPAGLLAPGSALMAAAAEEQAASGGHQCFDDWEGDQHAEALAMQLQDLLEPGTYTHQRQLEMKRAYWREHRERLQVSRDYDSVFDSRWVWEYIRGHWRGDMGAWAYESSGEEDDDGAEPAEGGEGAAAAQQPGSSPSRGARQAQQQRQQQSASGRGGRAAAQQPGSSPSGSTRRAQQQQRSASRRGGRAAAQQPGSSPSRSVREARQQPQQQEQRPELRRTTRINAGQPATGIFSPYLGSCAGSGGSSGGGGRRTSQLGVPLTPAGAAPSRA